MSSTLYGFVQAMVLFPEVQKKAQEKLDRVVGKDRLPEMEDMDSLRYIRGCMKEPLHWMLTTVIGAVPHAVTKDDEYMGYLIPKGAGVLNNVYGIHHDPKRFPDPRRFDPDRYKDDLQSLCEAASNPDASNEARSLLVQVEGYASACLLRGGVCSWASRGCSEHLTFRLLWIRLLARV
jgi:cytochrome P450